MMTNVRGRGPAQPPVRASRAILLLLLALVSHGCSGLGDGLDENGRPGIEGGGGGPLLPTWQSIQDNVFTPICTACHVGASPPQGLNLEEANSYALLVDVASVEQSAIDRVSTGDPNNSYIIMKLEGDAGISGGRMPLGGPFLDQSTIDVIRLWITDGALP